ncbi:MAG: ATP-binding protein [Deltaproteobacteria bacterium]|nr:ATP-binding protein [Deltaproteobacteria bacterium]
MDAATLAGLKAAFAVAPSAELAKIVFLHADESLEKLRPFIDAIEGPLNDDDEAAQIASRLLDEGCYTDAVRLLDAATPLQGVWLARAHLQLDAPEIAKALYENAVAKCPELVDDALGEKFGISKEISRPKLRVVGRDDDAELVDLTAFREKTTDFSNVVGLDDVKKQVRKKIILPFQKPSLFQRFKKRVGGGVLLFGPPGCGKTLIARATAGECNARFFNVEISDVLDMYIGESEKRLHGIFEKARDEKPSILFFDELEALAGKREHKSNSSSNVVSQFLTELDGYSQENTGVLVLASTNVPWALDSAFLRPGRFDRMFFVPPPDKAARQAILEHHLKGRPIEGTIDIAGIAAKAGGFSGADLEHLVDMTADEAIDESLESDSDDVGIRQKHFKEALKSARPTTLEWLTTARNYARYANDGGRYDDVLDFLRTHGKR